MKKLVMIWTALMMVFGLTVSVSTTATAAENTKEMVYVGGYDRLFVIDPAEQELAAEIAIQGPVRDIAWPADGSRLYVNTESRRTVTVINTKTNQIVDRIGFSTRDYDALVYGLAVDPQGEKLYATLMRSRLNGVEYEVLPPVIQVMDLNTKAVVKEIEVPWGTHALQFFTDGERLAVWAQDLYIYDLKTEKLELYKYIMNPPTAENGYGNFLYFWNRDRDAHNVSTFVIYKLWPETGEITEGLYMLDLETGEVKDVVFNEAPLGLFSGSLTPDKKFAYVGMNYIAKVNLETGKHVKVIPHEPGTSYGYNLSQDGKTLYVSGAGPDFTFYDAETMEIQKIIPLSSDTMDVRVVQIQQ